VAPAEVRSGQELYGAACAACHGSVGTGLSQSVLGFDTEVPDFTDCSFATPEADADWLAVAHQGGPVRAFDRRMPAFGEALSEEEILRAIAHIRGFCISSAWPRGELNLPRAIVTEKAFPENEAVWTTTIRADGPGAVGNELLYEKRFGARSQMELVVPIALEQAAEGAGWSRGLGDVSFAVKHVLHHSIETGRIFSAGTELILPTGKEADGLGKGVTVVEPFLAFGQMLPRDAFVQFQGGGEVPTDRDRASPETFWRVAAGKTVVQGRFGRSWTPMVELLGAREMEHGEPATWDLLPQMQVSASKRQHILVSVGVRIPLNERQDRHPQVVTYVLWDWFDGGLFEGWR
jgi:hypothetical protein